MTAGAEVVRERGNLLATTKPLYRFDAERRGHIAHAFLGKTVLVELRPFRNDPHSTDRDVVGELVAVGWARGLGRGLGTCILSIRVGDDRLDECSSAATVGMIREVHPGSARGVFGRGEATK